MNKYVRFIYNNSTKEGKGLKLKNDVDFLTKTNFKEINKSDYKKFTENGNMSH